MHSPDTRRTFYIGLWTGLKVAWPVLSGLLGSMALLGLAVARLEGWNWPEGLYFAFISGLTIGYGDLVPKRAMSRFLAVAIGIVGVLLVALIAAIAVRALNSVQSQEPRE